MKCIACGEENVQNARFCAFCGAKLSSEAESKPQPAPEEKTPLRQTARPLADNPYQPHRAPVIPAASTAEPTEAVKAAEAAEAERTRRAEAEAARDSSGPRQIIKPAPQRVFLFDEEQEEEEMKRQKAAQKPAIRLPDDDIDFEDDEEETDDDLYDEETEPRGGKIFVRIFSVLTVIALVIGIVSFLFGTTIGSRLRASMGLSSEAEDYLLLADWQLAQHSMADASESYYNAFKLDQGDFDLALTVGQGFENAGDDARAEQLYSYLIDTWPQESEPYDRLMALLTRQGRTEQYEALLLYRAENQPGYAPPIIPAPAAPTASHEGGAYEGSIQLSLSADSADIYYTLDGTAPTADSFLYTGPITLGGGTHNIRAVAVRNGQTGPEWSASFIIS